MSALEKTYLFDHVYKNDYLHIFSNNIFKNSLLASEGFISACVILLINFRDISFYVIIAYTHLHRE